MNLLPVEEKISSKYSVTVRICNIPGAISYPDLREVYLPVTYEEGERIAALLHEIWHIDTGNYRDFSDSPLVALKKEASAWRWACSWMRDMGREIPASQIRRSMASYMRDLTRSGGVYIGI